MLRFAILAIGTTCLTLIIANILTVQFTIICMVEVGPGGEGESENGTMGEATNESRSGGVCSPDGIHSGERLRWSPGLQASIFSAFSWGALLATLPVSWLLQHYGTRRILTATGLLSALATLASPLAAYQGYAYFLLCRVVLGFSYTVLFPAVGAMTTHWASLEENGLFTGLLASATQLAPVVALPISGLLCSSNLGWPAVFYLQGTVSLFAFALFGALYRNQPRKHPLISTKELSHIDMGKPSLINKDDPPIPYRKISRSIPIWACLVAAFSNMWGSQIVLLFTPKYLHKVLGFPIGAVALLSTLPTLVQFFVKIFAGCLSDRLPLRNSLKAKIFNSLALFGMAFFLVLLALVPPTHRYTALAMLTLSMSSLGFHSGGFMKAVTLISMEFAPIVMGLIMLIDNIVWLLIPYVVHIVAPNNTVHEWQHIFYGTSGLLLITGLAFVFWGTAEPAEWALRGEKPSSGTSGLLLITGLAFVFWGTAEPAEWALRGEKPSSASLAALEQESFLRLTKIEDIKEKDSGDSFFRDPDDPEIKSLVRNISFNDNVTFA